MEQLTDFADARQSARCAYCGGSTENRDHVPSKVLLDEPFPANLPVVPACKSCNASFSLDEEYIACLIDCTVAGSVGADTAIREKIRTILKRKAEMVSRLMLARKEVDGRVSFAIEASRVRNVVLKQARGHAVYELSEPQLNEPYSLTFVPLISMAPEVRTRFETPPRTAVWPEVGSRAMQRLAASPYATPDWIIVQPWRYRYLTAVGDAIVVRMVISEYLACDVVW